MSPSRITIFLINVLVIWTVLNLYTFWRIASVPFVASHISRRGLVWVAVALWAIYPLSRILGSWRWDVVARPLEFAGAVWIGALFLVFSAVLITDLLTVGGLLLPRLAPVLRGWALAIALVLAAVGLVQALRPPVLRDYEVQLAGLPRERDGLQVIEISDLHLGTLIGQRWMARLVNRVNQLKPDLVVVVGDVVDGNARQVEPLLPVLKSLQAPLGVWAVTGNHEFYAGLDRSVRLLEEAGWTVLRDRWAEVVPGLVLAGVDDLTARRQYRLDTQVVGKVLANRPPGAVILLSHSPLQADTAAAAGAGLMLSGHTHNGQIWPFTYLVRLSYPLMAGRYQVGGLPVIVCRGTGTWGPRMRLWRPSEIIRVRLKAPGSSATPGT